MDNDTKNSWNGAKYKFVTLKNIRHIIKPNFVGLSNGKSKLVHCHATHHPIGVGVPLFAFFVLAVFSRQHSIAL